MNLQSLTSLAQTLVERPELHGILAETYPEDYEQFQKFVTTPLFSWKPFGDTLSDGNQCQIGFTGSSHKNKWAVTGNRCGKTESAAAELLADCLGLDILTKGVSTKGASGGLESFANRPCHAWAVGDTEDTCIDILEKSIYKHLGQDESGFLWNFVEDGCKYSEKNGWSGHFLQFTNGSFIRFKYHTQQRKTFQGTSLDKVWLDEEPPKDIYGECRARVMDKHGYVVGTLTPVYEKSRGIPWLYYDLYMNRQVRGLEFHNWSIFHNPYISEEAKEAFVQETDPDELEIRAYGMFVPMGVKLAFEHGLIREMREQTQEPEHVEMYLNEKGEIEVENARLRPKAMAQA
jgi:phage terminase large subunit-like protein